MLIANRGDKMENIVWTFFVLDFDGIYDNVEPDSDGVQPIVYLIPLERQKDVEHYAIMATKDFYSKDNKKLGLSITDYFEKWLYNNGCDFKVVGMIDLTFGERQVDYLADYIPREIV